MSRRRTRRRLDAALRRTVKITSARVRLTISADEPLAINPIIETSAWLEGRRIDTGLQLRAPSLLRLEDGLC
jgi:hypothetical protein